MLKLLVKSTLQDLQQPIYKIPTGLVRIYLSWCMGLLNIKKQWEQGPW